MILLALVILVAFHGVPGHAKEDTDMARANRLARKLLIVDTHIDIPYRLRNSPEDISRATEKGDFDYPRAAAGGLDAAFMSIYTPAKLEEERGARALADSLIDMVEGFALKWPDKFVLVASIDELMALKKTKKFGLLMGMENGSPIEGKLSNIKYFYDRGVRYITLTHSKDNHICDSSYDESEKWGGLSPFGRRVITEMNRLGIMIDVSHISDKSFYQVMEISQAPVIASHSSCRHFTPGFERNMSDRMIKRLAENGGVIQINFGSVFISDECRRRFYLGKEKAEQYAEEHNLDKQDKAVRKFRDEFFDENPVGFADVKDVADHIDHVVELVGVEHVGFGSDFDGVGDSLPVGLKDVSYYPNLIRELLARGYGEEDIGKICSGNLVRVWREVDRAASEMSIKR